MKINLHIDRLVLEGVNIETYQKIELRDAIQLALERQLLNQGIGSMPESNNNHQSANGGSISIKNIQGIESLGQQISNAVYRGITK